MFGSPDTATIHFASILILNSDWLLPTSVIAHYHKDAGTLTLF